MKPFRILHFVDDAELISLVQQQIKNHLVEVEVVATPAAYLEVLRQKEIHLILSDSQVADCSGGAAFAIAREHCPNVPFIVVYRQIDPEAAVSWLQQGVVDCVALEHLWRLGPVLQREIEAIQELPTTGASDTQQCSIQGMVQLISVVKELSLARNLETITQIVRRAARDLTGADGATFILREKDCCYYAEENAIEPLWKGRRFPIHACIGGWSMRHRQQVIIEDVYGDERIPIEAYRPTFIKSLLVVPIRTQDPIGAIGNYWAERHVVTPEEVQLLQALADTTSVAMENVQIYTELEQRVQERTLQLEAINQELEAFSYTLSHDLRAPLSVINMILGLFEAKYADQLKTEGRQYLEQFHTAIERMDTLITEILTLHRVTQYKIEPEKIDIGALVQGIIADLQATNPERHVTLTVPDQAFACADPMLLRVLLENLLSNAWKYTSKRSQAEIEFGLLEDLEDSQIFYVRDNGAGFDMEQAARLFAPFQRLHSSTEFPGTGVGLASVQRIIHKHGGRIWAKAAVDQGATFYFSLPVLPCKWG